MRLGFIVILVGTLYMLRNMNLIDSAAWSSLWPIILILIGIAMVGRRMVQHGKWCDCRSCLSGKYSMMGAYNKKCDCDCESCKTCEVRK